MIRLLSFKSQMPCPEAELYIYGTDTNEHKI